MAHCRDRDAARSDSEPRRITQNGERANQRVDVVERLAHAHEDEIQRVGATRPESTHDREELPDDLVRLEAPPEAHLGRRAERTAHRASHLAREAHGDPRTTDLARHVHGLDPGPFRLDEIRQAIVSMEQHTRTLASLKSNTPTPAEQKLELPPHLALDELLPHLAKSKPDLGARLTKIKQLMAQRSAALNQVDILLTRGFFLLVSKTHPHTKESRALIGNHQ